MDTIEWFLKEFSVAIRDCSLINERMYNSFDYVKTGNGFCHPRTLGLLSKLCWSMPKVAAVDIDMRYNKGRAVKFQPDISAVGMDGLPILIVDFESPNSSDARIIRKDVRPYAEWAEANLYYPPYVIVTSLPDAPTTDPPRTHYPRPRKMRTWEVRYTNEGGANDGHKEYADLILDNPFTYWYNHLRGEFAKFMRESPKVRYMPIYFVNINGTDIELVDVCGVRQDGPSSAEETNILLDLFWNQYPCLYNRFWTPEVKGESLLAKLSKNFPDQYKGIRLKADSV